MRRVGECPILDAMLKIHVSFVQLKVQLAGDLFGSWRIFFLGVRAALPTYYWLRPTGEDSFGLFVYLFRSAYPKYAFKTRFDALAVFLRVFDNKKFAVFFKAWNNCTTFFIIHDALPVLGLEHQCVTSIRYPLGILRLLQAIQTIRARFFWHELMLRYSFESIGAGKPRLRWCQLFAPFDVSASCSVLGRFVSCCCSWSWPSNSSMSEAHSSKYEPRLASWVLKKTIASSYLSTSRPFLQIEVSRLIWTDWPR